MTATGTEDDSEQAALAAWRDQICSRQTGHLLHALNRRMLAHGHAHGGGLPQRSLPCARRVRAQNPAAGVQPAARATAHIIQLTVPPAPAPVPQASPLAHALSAGRSPSSMPG